MRLAALYDIHGNLPALEAVMGDVRRAEVDAVVVGGDVLPGPMPRESMDLLLGLDLPVHFILGNGDREVLARMRGIESPTLPEQARESVFWTATELDASHAQAIATWPATLTLPDAAGRTVFFCHATPASDTAVFTRRTAEARLVPIFAGTTAPIVICGHTHMAFDRRVGGTRVVNAGSVGMPFGPPGAHWALIGSDVELQRTAYDLDAAATRIRRTAYPQADAFASGHVLKPPAEETMLDAFARVELRGL